MDINRIDQDYLLLALTPQLGPISFATLMQKFGSASAVLEASSSEIRPCLERIDALRALKDRVAQESVDAAVVWAQESNCRLMTLLDDDYPMRLAEGMIPPPLLFLRGNVDFLSRPMISLVGSRHASEQALKTAEWFAQELSGSGVTVVSGFAEGVDSAAHHGALLGKGKTVGILGTGIDRVYPAFNRSLAHEIADYGLLISEFPLGTSPLARNFPRRNRLIAALGLATVVIEGAEKSGSLITARLAGEMGRDVMAVPGSIYNPQVAGCHRLIKEGAKLVTCAQDILDECGIQSELLLEVGENQIKNIDDNLSDKEKQLLNIMGFDPMHPDVLAEKLNEHPANLYAQLLNLELSGRIVSTVGGRYQRIQ